MRSSSVPAFGAALLMSVLIGAQEPGAQPPERGQQRHAKSSERRDVAAHYASADIRVMAPGVVYNAGLLDLNAAYTKETGKTSL